MFAIFCVFNISLAWQWLYGCNGEAKNNYCCARWQHAAGDLCGPYGRHLNTSKYVTRLCVTKGVWERSTCMAIECVIIYLSAKLGTCWCIKPDPLRNSWSLKLPRVWDLKNVKHAAFQYVWLSNTYLCRLSLEGYSVISKLNCCACLCPFVGAHKCEGLQDDHCYSPGFAALMRTRKGTASSSFMSWRLASALIRIPGRGQNK